MGAMYGFSLAGFATGHWSTTHSTMSTAHSRQCRPALVADLSARPPRGTFWCHVLALPPGRKGLSRLWVPLFGMIFPLNFVLCRVTFPVLFINSSRLSCLAEPGLGAPLSSYLEGALYKLIYI